VNGNTWAFVIDEEGGVTLPPEFLLEAGWEVGDWVEFSLGDNAIHVRKVPETEVPPETADAP
jgi:hypothetical protein